jgi:hypothetical protein
LAFPRPSSWDRRWRDWLTATLVMFTVSAAWIVASPLMAVPDEPAHAVRAAAAVRGELVGVDSTEARGHVEFSVPPGIAEASSLTCFAFDGTVDASCQPDVDDALGPLVPGMSTAELNLNSYYVMVGWPSLFLGGEAGLVGMRLMSALLVAVAVGFAVMQLRMLPRHGWSLVALAVSMTPMVGWLSASVNPNALEWAAAVGLLSTLLALGRTDSPPRIMLERAGIVVATTLLLVSGRTVTLLWLLLVVVAAVIAAEPKRLVTVIRAPAVWAAAALCGTIAVAALVWAVRPPAYDPFIVEVPGMGGSFTEGFMRMLTDAPFYWQEMIGVFGWKDTPSLPIVVALLGAVLLGLLGTSLSVGRSRLLAAGVVLAAAMLLVPPVLQGLLLEDVGYMWQGRYMLPVLGMQMVIAGLILDEEVRASRGSRALQTAILLVAWATTVLAFIQVLRRFAVGLDAGLSALLFDPTWSPAIGTIGSILLAVVTVGVAFWLVRSAARGDVARDSPTSDAVLSRDAPAMAPEQPAPLPGPRPGRSH